MLLDLAGSDKHLRVALLEFIQRLEVRPPLHILWLLPDLLLYLPHPIQDLIDLLRSLGEHFHVPQVVSVVPLQVVQWVVKFVMDEFLDL